MGGAGANEESGVLSEVTAARSGDYEQIKEADPLSTSFIVICPKGMVSSSRRSLRG